jgi:hypothetical protein
LARKAAAMIGVSEVLLRSEARKSNVTRRAAPAALPRTIVAEPLDAAAQAELALIAIALKWPELRPDLLARAGNIGESSMKSTLREICESNQPQATLELAAMSGMTEVQRGRLSGLMIGSLISDPIASRRLIDDYLAALADHQRRSQVEELRRVAARGGEGEAAAAAQAVIALRRQGIQN